MMWGLRRNVETIFNAALDSVRASDATRRQLSIDEAGRLRIGDAWVRIGPRGVFAIAIGKASIAMIDAAAAALGDHFTAGLAVTKSESAAHDPRIAVIHGAHPVPDERSIAAGDAVLRFAAGVPDDAVVVCLISGGGSALAERLRDGVDLGQLQDLTSSLLRAGATIHELNAVRSRFSQIKAGGLLRALSHTRVHNLIVSDVVGDDLQTIASGPTAPPVDGDPGAIMRAYGLSGMAPSVDDGVHLSLPPTTVVASLSIAIDKAASTAESLGYAPVVLTRSLSGESREAGRLFAAMLADGASGTTSFGKRTCLLAGGETTVTVRGSGIGGRNTEAALAAAIRLSGVAGVAVGFLATDGDDGVTGASGAIVAGDTVEPSTLRKAKAALADNDSFTFLRERDTILVTGPTGTNVNDLVIALIGETR